MITVQAIQEKTALAFNVPTTALASSRRCASYVLPRHAAMYLARNLTRLTLMEIGEAFGGRGHDTVIHAVQAMRQRLAKDPALARTIAALVLRLTPADEPAQK